MADEGGGGAAAAGADGAANQRIREGDRDHYTVTLYEEGGKLLARKPAYHLKPDALEFALNKLTERRGFKPPKWFSREDLDEALKAAANRAREDFKAASNGKAPNGDGANTADDEAGAYFENEGGIWRRSFTRNGDATAEPLTNFTARIIEERAIDDGRELRRTYVVTASFEGRTSQFDEPAESFNSMDWVVAQLPTKAGVLPGRSTKEHAAWAIRQLSGATNSTTKYAHRGWRKLHGGEDEH